MALCWVTMTKHAARRDSCCRIRSCSSESRIAFLLALTEILTAASMHTIIPAASMRSEYPIGCSTPPRLRMYRNGTTHHHPKKCPAALMAMPVEKAAAPATA